MKRWIEFFEGEKNRLSMARLLTFMSFFPSTYILCRICTAEALGYYLAAYVVNYIGGKVSDCIRKKGDGDSNPA